MLMIVVEVVGLCSTEYKVKINIPLYFKYKDPWAVWTETTQCFACLVSQCQIYTDIYSRGSEDAENGSLPH